jgi:hypothetical protein
MQNKEIISKLPATAAEILAGFGNVSEEYVLFHLRKLEREGKVRRYLDNVFRPALQFEDEPLEAPPPEKPQFVKKAKECEGCGNVYYGLRDHFSNGTSKYCTECREQHKKQSMKASTKTCEACGETYVGLKKHFRESKITGVGRFWRPICKTCEDKA